jgi:hypothetical protein
LTKAVAINGHKKLGGFGSRGSGADAAQALGECFVESSARRFGERCGLGVAENFDRLLAGVYDNATVLALAEVLFNLCTKKRVESFVEIIGELADDGFALH